MIEKWIAYLRSPKGREQSAALHYQARIDELTAAGLTEDEAWDRIKADHLAGKTEERREAWARSKGRA